MHTGVMQRLLVLLFVLSSALAQNALVLTPQGSLKGSFNPQAQVAYFLGIPYAKAERWKAPQPARWKGVLEATQVGSACPQRASFFGRVGGYVPPQAEDCLSLNIWAPLGTPPDGGWPVMVWIHGGSFTSGSSVEAVYDGTTLASRGAVIVTINYHLWVFISLPLPALLSEAPLKSFFNYGPLDQLEALRWVQRNIQSFGGNPQNVTLFGQSAGGMPVCTLMGSPLAKGLFQKAIIQSGGCEYVKTLGQGFKYGEGLAKLLGCDPGDLACLRALPTERFFPPDESPLLEQIMRLVGESFAERPYKPHVDGYVLDMTPLEALRKGRAAGIPLIAGATTQETWGERLLVGDWKTFAEKAKQYLPDRVERVVADYQRRYANPGDAWGYLVGDFVLFCPSLDAAKAQAPYAPSYAYIFDYRSEILPDLGAFHGFDVPWTFGMQGTWPIVALYLTEAALQRSIEPSGKWQAYLVRFAQDGDPKGFPRWREYSAGQVVYFGAYVGLRPDPYAERCGILR